MVWLVGGLVAVAAIGVALVVGLGWLGDEEKVEMRLNVEDRLIVVGNGQYEAAFHMDYGGIMYVKDTSSDMPISVGNQTLWWAILGDDTSVQSTNVDAFSYEWDKQANNLKLLFDGALGVEVNVRFGEDSRMYMNASLENRTGQTIKLFRFPFELKVEHSQVQDAILPMLPGAKLNQAFFQESNSFSDQYPGVMFASYLSMRTKAGNLAMYDLSGDTIPLTEIGYKHQINDSGKTAYVHNYKTWVKPEQAWSSPTIVLEIGSDYEQSIVSYRNLNGIEQYDSLTAKLGNQASQYFELPLYKTDISAIKDASWSQLSTAFINQMNYNGMIHLVGFQTGGHDENYPDFYPPDPMWGGEGEFQSFIKHAKEKGNIVVPYTNMSWWGNYSPTLNELPAGTTLADIVVKKENGSLMQEDYGRHSGYVVNTAHPFFRERIAAEHKKLIEQAGFDGIFEDQWGIRNSPYVYNDELIEGTDPSTSYFKGVQQYVKTIEHRLYMEDGTDVLANDSIGFMGSTYLWDLLGYRKYTASYTEYYPLAGMLFRDKVMQYHHNLAGETMTDDHQMLRWNIAMGYHLSADFYNGVTSPWVDAVAIFQKYVLSQYADQLVLQYEQVDTNVTKTDFGTYYATVNWDDDHAYKLDKETTLSAGGFDVRAINGTVRAGNYAVYNGLALDAGEHDLVEVRTDKAIRIYQPIGTDTTLKIKKGKQWPYTAAAAYTANGSKIADLAVIEDGDFVQFDYVASIKQQKVGYVELTSSEQPSQVTERYSKVKAEINIALGKSITATSLTDAAFDPKLAIDGDPFTYWESTAQKFPQSLTVNLGEPIDANKLKLRLPPQIAWELRTQDIEVLGSMNGSTYDVLQALDTYTYDPTSGNEVEILLDDVTNVQYIQVTIHSNSAWPAGQVSELEIY